MLPAAARTLQSIRTELSEGYRFVSGNKLPEAQTTFRSVLQALLLIVVSSDNEAKEVSAISSLNITLTHYTASGEIR